MNRIEVAAGLVFRDGRLLITKRLPGTHLAGLWEFPGGKREAGETFEDCLARELWEELRIRVEVLELFESVAHDYPDKSVLLRFFHCHWLQHEPQALGCAGFAWISRAELEAYAFPPADARLIARLMDSVELWKS